MGEDTNNDDAKCENIGDVQCYKEVKQNGNWCDDVNPYVCSRED